MKKIHLFTALGAALLVSACTSTVSRGVNADGSVEELVWPGLEDSWRDEALRLPSHNIATVRVGLDRRNVFDLLDVPHFKEINGAREWNYIFQRPEYTRENQAVCHMKLIYDKDDRVSAIYWMPEDCASVYGGEPYRLSADALFDFNASTLRPGAQTSLDDLLGKIHARGDKHSITVTGYTDRLGDSAYNQRLSQARAETVRDYLIAGGISADRVNAVGRGEANPVSNCSSGLSRGELISCLQPDRRVEVTVGNASR
ncbi:MAG: OmpA family protein [Cardiobacteriaceae bacterium]|nr:OmpA family protein [Cardiobacteriaceae bacterium]